MVETRRAGGFTLLETLVAMALLSLTLTLAFAGMRHGATAWDRQTAFATERQRHAGVVDYLRRQLRAAVPQPRPAQATGKPPPGGFVGDGRSARWVAPVAAEFGPGGWVEVALRLEQDADGDRLVLELTALDPRDDGPTERRERRVLLEGLPDLELRYWGLAGVNRQWRWHQRWDGEEPELPRLLQLAARDSQDQALWPDLLAAVGPQ